ncbi:hypothetical protein GCM10011501_16130 [Thalassotalea profundi]|uniref:Uncharacterized protein n=1 Tax=Thalassotalea profundi TaxID=2036687 RepID=A0ABQ3ILU3_9GAMM|nr:hypothetical protein GCM10011501_16130 [Thalassotalea profundi]
MSSINRILMNLYLTDTKRVTKMKANQKNMLITALIAAAVSAVVVYASNNIDVVEDIIG